MFVDLNNGKRKKENITRFFVIEQYGSRYKSLETNVLTDFTKRIISYENCSIVYVHYYYYIILKYKFDLQKETLKPFLIPGFIMVYTIN